MAKYTYKQIKKIQERTPKELKGKSIYDFNSGERLKVGGLCKYFLNWDFKVYVAQHNQKLIEVVTVSGTII